MMKKKKHEYAVHAKEIFDTIQATQCVVQALNKFISALWNKYKEVGCKRPWRRTLLFNQWIA